MSDGDVGDVEDDGKFVVRVFGGCLVDGSIIRGHSSLSRRGDPNWVERL